MAGLGQEMNTGDREFTDRVSDESSPAAGGREGLVDLSEPTGTESVPGAVVVAPEVEQTPATAEPLTTPADRAPRLTRASAAWAASTAALLLAVVLIVFVLQNPTVVVLHFLWFTGSVAVGMALLIAAVTGGLLVAAIGVARLTQLRVRSHRTRRQLARQ